MAKRILALTIGVLCMLSMVAYAAPQFSDVTESYAWAQTAIDELAEAEVITGYPDGTFKPGKSITKEESIALFSRMLGSKEKMNASVVSLSNVLFEDKLATYDTYAKESAAYLMYKKVLTSADLVTYLSSAKPGKLVFESTISQGFLPCFLVFPVLRLQAFLQEFLSSRI